MKKSRTEGMKRPGMVMVLATLSAVTLALSGAAMAQTVPTDAAGGCPIAPATVASFFESGSVTLNGVAKPADSTKVLAPNCGFFQWTEQMFLWLTSPAPASYGGNSLIMFSPKFFTVSPPDASGSRTFIPNSPGLPIRMLLRTTELGPRGLPALLSRSGQVIEVQRQAAGQAAPPVIRLQNGATARLGNVTAAPNGTLQFFDQGGRQVQASQLNLPTIVRPRIEIAPNRTAAVVPPTALSQAVQARKFIINRIPIFLDPAGNVIDVEPGQADDGVLIAQNGALVYYITAVNDVLAFHRTMQGATIPNPTTIKFPMTSADANAVKTFAAAAITGTPVGPTPVLRAKPWGSNDGGSPANAAALNTQVISANASVLSQLAAVDVRAKYFQLGTTWTIGGAPPGGSNEVGTNHLANATIETFVEGASPSAASANCFSCHLSNTVQVSHVYGALKPLP